MEERNIGRRHTPETKAKLSLAQRAYIAVDPSTRTPYVRNHWSKGPSYPERYFAEVFEREGLIVSEQHPVGRYKLDFAVLNRMVDIEINGNQHYCDPKYAEHDVKRRAKLSGLGWHVIEIRWSHFMRLSPEEKQRFVQELIAAVQARSVVEVPEKPRATKLKRVWVPRPKVINPNTTCPGCQTEVVAPRKNQTYCTRACRMKHRYPHRKPPRLPSADWTPCPTCGKPATRTYCSDACFKKASRRAKVEDAEIVAYLRKNDFSYEQAGRHFGCSGNAVKKRARKLIELPAKQRILNGNEITDAFAFAGSIKGASRLLRCDPERIRVFFRDAVNPADYEPATCDLKESRSYASELRVQKDGAR